MLVDPARFYGKTVFDSSNKTLGHQEKFLGKVQIDLATSEVKSRKDIVLLQKTTEETKGSFELQD